jgi:hypothetical protein
LAGVWDEGIAQQKSVVVFNNLDLLVNTLWFAGNALCALEQMILDRFSIEQTVAPNATNICPALGVN